MRVGVTGGLYLFNLDRRKSDCPIEHISTMWANFVYVKLLVT